MGKRLAYSVAEVAEMLGVSERTVYDAVRRGDIPVVNFVGSRVLIPAHGLEERVAALSAPRGAA